VFSDYPKDGAYDSSGTTIMANRYVRHEYTTVPVHEQGEIYVDVYNPYKACNGTTLFADLHDQAHPRILEIDMLAEIVWEYTIPEDLKQHSQPGLDVEMLSNGNVLFVLPGNGVYEIDRNGDIAWFHLDEEISHDADRLSNGNTLYVYGDDDRVNDPQAKEVDQQGQLIWSWYAKDDFYVEPYIGIWDAGWTHANAVTRLTNGNTLVSLRNLYLTVEVNSLGDLVWSYDWTVFGGSDPDPHEPEILPNDNLLICLQNDSPYQAVQIDRNTGQAVWQYYRSGLRTCRDCDRLPNGNTLIVGVLQDGQESVIFEVSQDDEVVWQLKVMDTPADNSPGWFYKAQRLCQQY
jgi:hypothetical protein